MTSPAVLFDARSAGAARLSGWERYTRGLVALLAPAPEVTLRVSDPGAFSARLAADLLTLPRHARRHRLVHHPTFPPAAVTTPTVMTLHDLTWWTHPETASRGGRLYHRRLAERALGRATVATVSYTVADEIRERFGVDAHVVQPWVLSRAVAPAVRSRPYVLAVGSIEPRKNLDRLVRAYRASGLSGRIDLVIAGRRAWGELVGGDELPEGVELVEAPGDDSLWALVRGSAALVLPSLYEGFGMPVVEAQSVGVPVLCSDLPVLREVSGGHAALFDPLDEQAIATTLDAVDTDPEKTVAALGLDLDAARAHSTVYGPATTARQLEELYAAHGVEVRLTPI